MEEAGQALERLDGKINELDTRIDNNWESMSQKARQDARANLNRLREQKRIGRLVRQLQKQLGRCLG